MAEQDKDAKSAGDDKSINDLLKEYADDVKDKDFDDFLKTDDEAFESEDSAEEDDGEKQPEAEPKKSGGFFTGLLLLVAFCAAGAGTYIYLNRDNEGMTAIMGGFMGSNDNQSEISMAQPPAPDAAPSMPATDSTSSEPSPFDAQPPAAPAPIMNEPMPEATAAPVGEALPPAAELAPAPAADATAPDMLAMPAAKEDAPKAPEAPAVAEAPAPAPAPVADTVAAAPAMPDLPAPQADAAPAAPVAPAAPTATEDAVNAWASGTAPANTGEKLPETAVEEVKAKPAKMPAADKTAATDAPKKDATKAAAAPKQAKASSSQDAALPPPYLAIQAKNGTAPSAAPAKMAPVVETATRNVNEADATKATGDYRNMVMQGGGKIEIAGSKTTFVPAGQGDAAVAAPVAPAMPAEAASAPVSDAPRKLAIAGGRSMPDSYEPIIDTPTLRASVPVQQPAAVAPKAMPVEEAAPAPAAPAPAAAPQAATGTTDAKGVLAAAMAAEKAGNASQAIELYQRALELDAVYGNGKSIDRGMVYDRIGAIRAAGQ
ncbi:MAG: hypothetical protein KGQ41_02140 [Alphaproteobacteria bacterium]|nr:hypothetical protein [Alphaproteobacteria bacterium]